MPRICYVKKRFRAEYLQMIRQANEIIAEYAAAGYDLTLRQLYYQFVARGLLENNMPNYKKLGNVVNDARLAGLIDWNHITDRTRGLESLSTWNTPASIVGACASQYRVDKWETQPYRVECWIEKEALAGVFERICNELRVPYLSCRGYTSQSEMWRAGMRLKDFVDGGQNVLILHFGDHDPSGIDMSRDITERLEMFMGGVEFKRLALNMDQVNEYTPPPNPAKLTDTRATAYISRFGDESWELDALEPQVLSDLVRHAVEDVMDEDAWQEQTEKEEEGKRLLGEVASNWDKITRKL
jgi:hypothetical protein